MGLFSREADESDRHGLVVAMLTESEPVRQLMAANQLEPVVRWVGAEPQLEVRRELLNRLMYPGAAEQVLAKARLRAEVVAWIKAEPDPSHRSSAVQTTLYNPQVWHASLSGGRPELLDELVALESDPEARRMVWRYMLATPSGLVAYHVERGEHPQALQLLEKNADHDLGRLHLATYLLATGQIEPRMAEVRRRLEQAPQASEARLLVYLARARGDLPAARRAAEQADDPGLLQAVLVEQHAWAEAAALQAAGPCPLPIPTREQSILKAGRRRAEQLNLLAAYQRLAGAERDFEQTVAQLKELAGENRRDPEVQWLCGVGLILNERWDDGLALVAGVHPLRAFDRLCDRHQYREALELAGWKSDTEASRQWLARLPTTKADFREPPEQRFTWALRVAALLHRLGDRQAAKQVLAVLTSYAREAPDWSVSPPNSGPWLDVLARLMELGETELSWELGIGGSRFWTSSEPLLRHIYEARFQEASAWWQLLSRSRPGEPERWTFQRARLGLDGPPPETPGPLPIWWRKPNGTSPRCSITIRARLGWPSLTPIGGAACRTGNCRA